VKSARGETKTNDGIEEREEEAEGGMEVATGGTVLIVPTAPNVVQIVVQIAVQIAVQIVVQIEVQIEVQIVVQIAVQIAVQIVVQIVVVMIGIAVVITVGRRERTVIDGNLLSMEVPVVAARPNVRKKRSVKDLSRDRALVPLQPRVLPPQTKRDCALKKTCSDLSTNTMMFDGTSYTIIN